jgi:predicted dehydrogenase
MLLDPSSETSPDPYTDALPANGGSAHKTRRVKPLTLAILGCGARGRTYSRIAAAMPDSLTITAAVDRHPERVHQVTALAHGACAFHDESSFFAAGKLADVLLICTQDADHYRHAVAALHLGYDILLEKPAARTLEECLDLHRLAQQVGRRIALCFVLRHTPFYSAVGSFIESGRLGSVVTARFSEGVEPFHQAHSFVRGHWAKSADSSPMIVAKCSHDTDLICQFTKSAPRSVSSIGSTSWFHRGNLPQGAPARCTDGCPAAAHCSYDAHRYLGDKRRWLGMVMDRAEDASDEEILAFLRKSPWGRCVYQCDNDAVDHQILQVEMENGVSASLTMTAFDQERSIEIHGTRGSLRGGVPFREAGAPELWFHDHATGAREAIEIAAASTQGYAGHGGGDFGLMAALPRMMRGPDELPPGLDGLDGHRLAFLAEEARLGRRMVEVAAGGSA